MSGRTGAREGGLVLRGIGAGTGLGARLTAVLDESLDADRMRRGRSIGRSGAVSSMRIGSGAVSGEVSGSQLRDFSACFRVRPLDVQDRAELVDTVRGAPGALSALASGSVPDELAARLLPADMDDLGFGCTCPDEGRGCKHAVALALLAAQDIQRAPVRLLALRGVDLAVLIDAASGSVGGSEGDRAAGAGPESRAGPQHAADLFEPATVLPPLPVPPADGTALDLLDTARLRSLLRLWVSETGQAERELESMYRRITADDRPSGGGSGGLT